MEQQRPLQAIANFAQVASVLMFVAVLFLARDVLIPVALGILIAFVLSPIVNRLQRWGVSNSIAVISTALLVFAGLSLFLMLAGTHIAGFSEELPKYRAELRKKVDAGKRMVGQLGSTFSELSEAVEEDGSPNSVPDKGENDQNALSRLLFGNNKPQNDGASPERPLYVVESAQRAADVRSWAGGIATILGPVGTAGLVSVFALFALLYRSDLRDRFVAAISRGNYVVTSEALNEASTRIGKYLRAQLLLNVSYGVIFAVGLLLIGYFLAPDGVFPYVVLLGTMAGLVRFIPYAGPMIGAAIPLLLSILLFPGFQVVAAVAVMIIAMELVFNNVCEPWLYGSSTGVSPVAIIFSAVFWTWLWGPIGLLLATPLTVCAVVLGQYVPRFRFLMMLLSDEIQVKPGIRCFQRLLSGDNHFVTEFLKSESKDRTVPELLDDVVVPTIKLILVDKDKRERSDAEMCQLLKEGLIAANVLSDERMESIEPQAAAEGNPAALVGVAVRHEGEDIVLTALSQFVSQFSPEVGPFKVFTSEELSDQDAERIAEMNPKVVVMCVIPPGGLPQTRYWCTALREAGYPGQIIVACLGNFKNYDRILFSLRQRGANKVVTSAQQLAQRLHRFSKSCKVACKPDNATSTGAIADRSVRSKSVEKDSTSEEAAEREMFDSAST